MDTVINLNINTKDNDLTLDSYKSIRIAIWLYFLLWIFEGALRKWILPGLATPLLMVRDPVAIFIVLKAFHLNVKFLNGYVISSMVLTLLSLIITLTFGHSNIIVGLYGARIMMIHFPLIFIIGEVFSKKDVVKIGKALLAINILMTFIVYLQFVSPQSALINVGIGGEGSSGFFGANGYFRPPGTFSFISGLATFYIFVSVFVFYFWLTSEPVSKILLYLSTLALIFGLPLSVSRTAVGGVFLVGVFALLGAVTNFKTIVKMVFTIILLSLFFIVLQKTTSIFNKGTDAFMSRVDTANKHSKNGSFKEAFFVRALDDFISPIVDLMKEPMFVGKLGMGTNVGAQILSGKKGFLIAEDELARIGGEQGIVLGAGILIVRLGLAFGLFFQSIRLPEKEKLLPLLLCGAGLYYLTQGQWAQPNLLGYSVFVVGLLVASMNKTNNTI